MARKEKGGEPEKTEEEVQQGEEEKQEDIHIETHDIKTACMIVEEFPKMTVEVVGLKMYQNIGTMFMQAALVQC